MLQWILRIIVIVTVLGSGTGLSSDVQQRGVDVDPIAEENLVPATPPAAESGSAEKAAEDAMDRDPQKAESAPGNLNTTEDASEKPADPSFGGLGKNGSQTSAPQAVKDETGAEKKESAPSGVEKKAKQDQQEDDGSGAKVQKQEAVA
jgi:hypothetical protein